MRQALLQVKEELGADAVIMSNKKVAGGVEIVAAIDGDTAQPERQMGSNALAAPSRSALPNYGRDLKDDVVNLQKSSAAPTGSALPSMTDRFANMLKSYRGNDNEQSKPKNTPPDSLSALLERQSERSKSAGDSRSVSDGYQNSDRLQYAQQNRTESLSETAKKVLVPLIALTMAI